MRKYSSYINGKKNKLNKLLLPFILAMIGFNLIGGCSSAIGIHESETRSVITQTPTNSTSIIPLATKNGTINNPTLQILNTPTTTITIQDDPSRTPLVNRCGPSIDDKQCVISLINNNNGCEFPCWWGIVPGKTEYLEADNYLREISSYDSLLEENEKGKLHEYGFPSSVAILYVNIHESGKANIIEFNADLRLKNESLSTFYGVFKEYLPSEILAIYGKPDRINFDLAIPVVNTYGNSTYYLELIYRKQNFMIGYVGYAQNKKGIFYSCPSNWNDGQYIERLKFVSQSQSVDTSLESSYSSLLIPGYSIENLSTTTLDEFYEKMLKDSTTCIETPEILLSG
jgi:hypothetical protein